MRTRDRKVFRNSSTIGIGERRRVVGSSLKTKGKEGGVVVKVFENGDTNITLIKKIKLNEIKLGTKRPRALYVNQGGYATTVIGISNGGIELLLAAIQEART